ncbi:MAG: glutamate synthase-related protein, partial [Methanomassiliicoccales archaeon]
MYERYHIHVKVTPPRQSPVPKFLIKRADNCINCGKCTRSCVYGVHLRREDDPRKMAEPISQLCKNCFCCIVECPQRALTIANNAQWKGMGSGVWSPQRVQTIWNESETGKIPVLGAGYRGLYSGPGYDSMWTDMSEIVRPTRDGIHGREFISTSVDIGRKPNKLAFDKQGRLLTQLTEVIDRPVPFMLDVTRFDALTTAMLEGYAMAAKELQSLLLLPYGRGSEVQGKAPGALVPVLGSEDDPSKVDLSGIQMVEIEESPEWRTKFDILRHRYPRLIIGLRVSSRMGLEEEVADMAKKVDVIHVLFLESGMEEGGRWAKDAMRSVHRALVRKGVRDDVTLFSAGGISAAEMVPKAIICGADAICL